MLHNPAVTVNMQDEQQAVVSGRGVQIQDARAYSPKLVAVMGLEDAIALARAILSFAESTPELIDDEDDYFDHLARREEMKREARWDAISERK